MAFVKGGGAVVAGEASSLFVVVLENSISLENFPRSKMSPYVHPADSEI